MGCCKTARQPRCGTSRGMPQTERLYVRYKSTNVSYNMACRIAARRTVHIYLGLRIFTCLTKQIKRNEHAALPNTYVTEYVAARAHARRSSLHHTRQIERSHAMAPACGRSFLSAGASPRYFSTSSLAACSRGTKHGKLFMRLLVDTP